MNISDKDLVSPSCPNQNPSRAGADTCRNLHRNCFPRAQRDISYCYQQTIFEVVISARDTRQLTPRFLFHNRYSPSSSVPPAAYTPFHLSLRHAATKTPRARARMRPPGKAGCLSHASASWVLTCQVRSRLQRGRSRLQFFQENAGGVRFSYLALGLMERYALFSPSQAPL
jgi:hypothetical protein